MFFSMYYNIISLEKKLCIIAYSRECYRWGHECGYHAEIRYDNALKLITRIRKYAIENNLPDDAPEWDLSMYIGFDGNDSRPDQPSGDHIYFDRPAPALREETMLREPLPIDGMAWTPTPQTATATNMHWDGVAWHSYRYIQPIQTTQIATTTYVTAGATNVL